jgi:hypothetical protein
LRQPCGRLAPTGEADDANPSRPQEPIPRKRLALEADHMKIDWAFTGIVVLGLLFWASWVWMFVKAVS